MKVAVFSDTHGSTALMVQAVRRSQPDAVLHLGDYDMDADVLRREFPGLPVHAVRGNCDRLSTAPMWEVVPLGPVKAFLTHGHAYNVRWGRLDALVYAAQEQGAGLALFGHTHEPLYEEIGGVQVLNPGAAGRGRKPTWAVVEVFDNGGIACQIRDL